jgi:hypothetical protein
MARKQAQVHTLSSVNAAVEQAQVLAETRYELAIAAYEHQDDETRQAIDRIRDTIRLAATGYVHVNLDPPHSGVVTVKLEQKWIDFNLLYIAVDIVKTLAIFDIKLANFEFPPSLCTDCGAEITGQKRRKKRGA